MIVVISSRVNDGFFCQLHFPLPCPVCFADTHDVYDLKGHFSSYLRNVTTSVQCTYRGTYIPVSDLHDVLEVYQWPIQLGGVLLDRPQCSLDQVNFSAFGFCDNRVYGRGLSALGPTWRTRGSHLDCCLSFDLVEMGAP